MDKNLYNKIENRIKNVLEEYIDIKFKDIVVKYNKYSIFIYTNYLDLVYDIKNDLLELKVNYKPKKLKNLSKDLEIIKERIKEII